MVQEMSTNPNIIVRDLISDKSYNDRVDYNDYHITYAVKHALQIGSEDDFCSVLDSVIKMKDSDIERICGLHHQEFVQAVDQLLKIRVGVSQVKKDVLNLDTQMRDMGSKLIEKKKEVISNRRMLLNIDTVTEKIQIALLVLDIFGQINIYVEQKKFHSALRLMKELSMQHLRSIEKFDFYPNIISSIPIIETTIKETVMKSLKDWLVIIKEKMSEIGAHAIKNTLVKQQRVKNKACVAASNIGSVNVGVSLELALAEENEDSLIDPRENIDFKPLFECIHIHDALACRKDLENYFEENRKLQFNILLHTNVVVEKGNLESFDRFLKEVVGFFVVESCILTSTERFRSRGTVELLWVEILEMIHSVILNTLTDCDDPQVFVEMKKLAVSFIHSMEHYKYNVSKIRYAIVTLFDTYTELMKVKCRERLELASHDDDYMPLVVNTPEEYQTILKVFKFTEEKKFSMAKFPRTLSCSKGFVESCAYIKGFINNFYSFAEGFAQQNNEMDDLLKKSVESLLVQVIDSGFIQKLDGLNLTQVSQIVINLEYFESACSEFESLLSEKRSCHKGSKVNLQARDIFNASRRKGQKRIFELIIDKVDVTLQGVKFNWVVGILNTEPSSYLQEIFEYLINVVTATISQFPLTVKSQIYHDALAHLSAALLARISGSYTKKMNINFISNFHRDVLFIETSMSRLADVQVPDVFLELKETVEFLKSGNYEEILNSNVRNMKYPRIKVPVVTIILEKLANEGGLFSSTADKNKRKSIEFIIKNLRGDTH